MKALPRATRSRWTLARPTSRRQGGIHPLRHRVGAGSTANIASYSRQAQLERDDSRPSLCYDYYSLADPLPLSARNCDGMVSLFQRRNSSLVGFRSFSTTTSTRPLMDDSDMDPLRKRVQAWIDRKDGDLTPEDWFGIEDDVEVLVTQHTGESVELTFRLMDRLAKEQGVIATLTRAAWVDGAVLKKIVHNWFMVWKQRVANQSQHSNAALQQQAQAFISRYSPLVVYETVDRYCSFFNQAKWSSEVAYHIIAALNVLHKSKYDPAQHHHHQHRQQQQKPHLDGLTFAPMILENMLDKWKNGNEDCKPQRKLFQAVFNACTSTRIAQRDRKRAALQVDDLLSSVANEMGYTPDAQMFSSAVHAWAITRSYEGARLAHERLDQMWIVTREANEDVPQWMWVSAIRSAVSAWAWSKHPEALGRVEALMAQTSNFLESGVIYRDEKSRTIWDAALQTCASAKSPQAARFATRLFEQIQTPGETTFYWYIASLVNGGEVDRGEQLLVDLIKSGELDVREEYLAMVVHGWSRSSNPTRYDRARRLVEMFEYLGKSNLRITATTYNALLECCASVWSKSDDAANEAARVLKQMRYQASVKNDVSIGPDLKSYTTVIKCFAKQGNSKQAEALFNEMVAEYKETGSNKLKPDTVIFNAVLSAYSRSKDEDALEGAQTFFHKFLDDKDTGGLSPDTFSFTSLVATIARASGENQHVAAERAKIASDLLDQVRTLYADGTTEWQPSTPMYNAVLNCWANAASPEECEATLELMMKDYNSGNEKALPDIQSFNILLKSLGASNKEDSTARAEDIVFRIKDLHRDGVLSSGPNVVTYTTLIHCYARRGGPQAAIRGEEILREMEREHELGILDAPPNQRTYELVQRAKTNELAKSY